MRRYSSMYSIAHSINHSITHSLDRAAQIPLPRVLAVFIILLLLLLVTIILLVAIYFSILQLVHNGDKYTQRFNDLYDTIVNWAVTTFNVSRDVVIGWLPNISLSSLAVTFASVLYELIPQALLCVLFTIYMLLDYHDSEEKTDIQRTIDERVRRYILIKISVSLLTAVLVSIVLVMCRVDMWFLFSTLTFLLNFIPNIGSMVAVLLPMPIVFFDPDQHWYTILIVFIVPSIIHFTIGNIIEPTFLGTNMDMSAVSVLVCLAFWGYIWGLVGAFISVRSRFQQQRYLIPHTHSRSSPNRCH